MALRRCWRLTGGVPRLLWNNTVPCEACVPPGGRGSVSSSVSTRPGYKSEIQRYRLTVWNNAYTALRALSVLFLDTELLFRTFSSTPATIDVSYERLKELLAGRKAVVIDVREPWELREYGFIPGSINVPCECSSSLPEARD